MSNPAPVRLNLTQLKKQAKEILKAHHGGNRSVSSILRRLPRFATAQAEEILKAEVKLNDVQFALAREHGFRNWEHLKAYIESLTPPPVDQQPEIKVRPIRRDELDRIVLRCWPPKRNDVLRLFDRQGTIGMAAWEGARCVGVVHGYRVDNPKTGSDSWPSWNNWWRPESWPAQTRMAALALPGPIWCHACFHVGRTLASDCEETLSLVRRFAVSNDWDPEQTTAALNKLDGVELDLQYVSTVLTELRRTGVTRFADIEPRYYGRGIGTALCKASVYWAQDNGYAAAAGLGSPAEFFELAVWSGFLPHTTYAKLGFQTLGPLEPEDRLPKWARDSLPEVMRQAEQAIRDGRTTENFHVRLMALAF